MDAERQQRLHSTFVELIGLDRAVRAARLDELEREDAELAGELRRLLRHHDHPVAFLADVEAAAGRRTGPSAPVPEKVGPYPIEGLLGRGGMGIVYRGRQPSTGRAVAVKVLRPGLLTDAMSRRFRREVQVLALLNHPGIAQVYDAGTCDLGFGEQSFFAMELVDGAPLGTANGVLPAVRDATVDQRCELIARLADALEHAHQRGVVHRDLKPANILITGTASDPHGLQPKIIDFGIARSGDEDLAKVTMLTSEGTLLGTLPYMSPEQASAGLVSRASDVYSMGVLLYEVLTDRLPLDLLNKTLTEALRILQDKEPPRLRRFDRLLRGDLEVVAGKAMAKDVAQRYPSAAALAEDLRRFVRREPVFARPLTVGYQVRRFARRNVALTLSLSGLLVTLLAGMGGTTLFAVRADANAERAARRAYAGQSLAASTQVRRDPYGSAAALAGTDPRYRGIEWRLMTALVDRADLLFELPKGARHSRGAYSPTGAPTIAYATGDHIRVVDIRSSSVVGEWHAPSEPFELYLSPDASLVGAALEPQDRFCRRLMVWRSTGGQPLFDRKDPKVMVWKLAFSPDNHFMLTRGHYSGRPLLRVDLQASDWVTFRSSGGYEPIRVLDDSNSYSDRGRRYDIRTGRVTGSLLDYNGLALPSPDGRLIAGTILVHRLVYLAEAARRETREHGLVALRGDPTHLQFSADGSLLLCASYMAGQIKVCNTTTRQVLHDIAIPCEHEPVMHPAGDSVLSATPRGIELVALQRSRRILGPHRDYVTAAAWSPDGQLIASTDVKGTVSLWDADDGTLLRASRPYSQEPLGIAFTRDGLSLILTSKHRFHYAVDLATGVREPLPKEQQRGGIDSPIWERVQPGGRLWRSHAMSVDGTTVVVGTSTKLLGGGATSVLPRFSEALKGLPQQRGLTGGIQERMARQWNPSKGMPSALSGDRRLLATGHDRGWIVLWDLQTKAMVRALRGHTGHVMSLAFTPDGRLLSGGIDSNLCVWDPETGDLLARFDEHDRAIECTAVSPDGTRFLTASADRTVRIWDTIVGWQRARNASEILRRKTAMAPRVEAVLARVGGDRRAALRAIWSDETLPLRDRQAARAVLLTR
ncbi:MAG: protein kinase [Planctomycetes bacterium]|nr:protein kinase [Planctomycetota bacterium]